MTAFPLTQPRERPVPIEQLRSAALVVCTPTKRTERMPPKLTRGRLTMPWLTIYHVSFWDGARWRGQVRFYLNSPAHRLVFPDSGASQARTGYASLDREHDRIVISWNGGPWITTIHAATSRYFIQSPLGDALQRYGYLADDDAIYVPVTITPGGITADLSTSYTKDDAIAHEETICAVAYASTSHPAS